jgi:predicted Ser/Thr protein kinase
MDYNKRMEKIEQNLDGRKGKTVKKEKIVVLDQNDNPLSPEEIEDIEGPMSPEGSFKKPDFVLIKNKLAEQGLEVIGDREMCSSGSFGPLFRIKIKDASGQEKYVLERTFTELKDIERRFLVVDKQVEEQMDTEPRYEVISAAEDKLLVDYLYNEAKALQNLQGINGIPKFYGYIDRDLLGSILEEFIDGYDLGLALSQENPGRRQELMTALEKVKTVYMEAAQAGYVHSDPLGATIMVDKDGQPYLVDWYLYEHGSIKSDELVRQKYLAGLKQITEARNRLLCQAA